MERSEEKSACFMSEIEIWDNMGGAGSPFSWPTELRGLPP